jgi:AcrR family transcriptional regulator
MLGMNESRARNAMQRPSGAPQRRRGQEWRRKLAEVTVRLAEERGFDALSVNEIAEEAGISVGGMYRYIRTKADLLRMACEGIFGGLQEEMLGAIHVERGIENKLAAAIRVYWSACYERADLIGLTYREYRSLPAEAQELYKQQELDIANVFRDLIRAGIVVDEFRDADERVVAHEIIFLAHMNVFKRWALPDVDPDRLLAEHVDLFVSRLRRDITVHPDPYQ